VRGSYFVQVGISNTRTHVNISRQSENRPSPQPNNGPPAVVVLAIAVACSAFTAYVTTWDAGITVFLAVISVFTSEV
jgi:uncharacterized membrane protein YjjP (DUF1212 family)